METQKNLKIIAKQLISRALNKLSAAKKLLETGFYDDAISRAYYSVFLASKALLILLGEEARSHKGIITLFGLRVVKENLLPMQYGKILTDLFNARQVSDYETLVFYSKSDTETYISAAEEFIKKIIEILKEKFQTSL
ncbi:MAG: HEPN domain-containing protein [Candidatus Wukongarchaeota archaeon]|nr:HEPN domain-containing protein [Candidatus Wukongarchaeota archaeon]